MSIVIKNGRIIDPASNRDEIADLLIENGIISNIGKNLTGDEIIDAAGLIVAPGLVDMHCHLRQPGYEYKEDIESGTKSAATGGFTSVACMPNTNPVIDNAAMVEYISAKAKATAKVNVFPIGAISVGQKGELLAEIGDMAASGAVAVSDDGHPVMNANLMRRAMQYADMFNIPVISHCEDLDLVDGGVVNEGLISTTMGLCGSTKAAEEVMVAREIILAETLNTRVHIAHISTKGSAEIIRQAKAKNVKVTCETCPHYFTLTEEAALGYNTNAKIDPPLRTKEDVEAIKKALADGTVDAIATDHAPHHTDEKNVEFGLAASGIVGFETALPLSVTYLVNQGVLSINQLIEKLSLNPSKILGLNKGTLGINSSADITIFDPNIEYEIDISKFHSKGKNSPFNGYKVNGKAIYTIVGGVVIAHNGEII